MSKSSFLRPSAATSVSIGTTLIGLLIGFDSFMMTVVIGVPALFALCVLFAAVRISKKMEQQSTVGGHFATKLELFVKKWRPGMALLGFYAGAIVSQFPFLFILFAIGIVVAVKMRPADEDNAED
ncbi:hypothetical protein [Seinonella peptonophila]|uniref:hypothetical protein n=1 Tax=Seinonella peptonophila TaxID=112248 RepID=UPI001114EAF6|nr:hypothetical protein [Seinonella peptonophila]